MTDWIQKAKNPHRLIARSMDIAEMERPPPASIQCKVLKVLNVKKENEKSANHGVCGAAARKRRGKNKTREGE